MFSFKNRLDAIYIDKIDGKISEDFYNQKFKEFSEDLEKLDVKIAKHTKAVNSGQQSRVTLYELAQEGKEKYLRGKDNDRRELMRMVFKKLELKGEDVTLKLKKSYRELKSLVKNTNSSKMGKIINSGNKIFEQYDLMKTSKYFASSQPECSVLLPALDSIRTCLS